MSPQEIQSGFQEIREMFRETDRKFQETDRKFNELRELFTSQWGRLVEALVAPGALRLFQERGIAVTGTTQRAKKRKNGEEMEIDILATNEDSIVAVEVKTTLKIEDVNDFLEKLPRFLAFFSEYKGLKIYGAVAGVNIAEQADRYAYKRGLFVLTLSGEGTVAILNDDKFVPKDYATGHENQTDA